ncbi:hypothetical protein [Oceanithermus sp.]|uniref:hypothetical protein n=1 Tax=Oceanithermus sp. TaxID=2268145 RepID=UPI0025ED6638|nr:hypothetical protein [Oceanithermus sp.]
METLPLHSTTPRYELTVYGPARLLHDGRPVPLHKKALALLYVLALDGPTRREVLADLLWGHEGARTNLRAELYHLRKTAQLSLGDRQNLLFLPGNVQLVRTPTAGGILEGLEDLSPEFDAWLTRKRFELETMGSATSAQELARELLKDLPNPGLWILSGPVGSGIKPIAKALAEATGLPFVDGAAGGARGLLYLEPPFERAPSLETLLRWPGVVVVVRPPFGEDPALLLELRAAYPVERTRYLEVPVAPFVTARKTLLADLPFAEAVGWYLGAHGRWELLEEMLRAKHELPLRFRARYRIEARRLPREARLALERLSIGRGRMKHALLERLGATEQIEELERRRWLTYADGWSFTDPVARRALAYDLPSGLKHEYHLRAAEVLETEGRALEAAWHRAQAGEAVDWNEVAQQTTGYARALLLGDATARPRTREEGRGEPLPLLPASARGQGLEHEGGTWWILRPEGAHDPTWTEWEPPDLPALLHLEGEVRVLAPLSGALDGTPPLELHLGPARVAFAPLTEPQLLEDGTWLLPALGPFAYTFYLPANTPLALTSRAPEVAAQLRLTAYAAGSDGETVEALDLTRPPISESRPGTLHAS